MTSSADLASSLLDYLRSHLGHPELVYSLEPRRLPKGMFAEVWEFAFASAPLGWSGAIVLRLYPSEADSLNLHVEAAVQNGLAGVGFPAPRVLLVEDGAEVLGHRFIVMERVRGRPAVRGLRWDRFLRDLPGLVRSWPSMLASAAARLHQSPTGAIKAEAANRGVSLPLIGWDRHLRRLEDLMASRSLPGWNEGLRWLNSHQPPAPSDPVVVHGDLWPANLLYEGRELTGVIDWDRAALGEPALDIGFAKAGWALMPAPTRVPPPAYQAMRLLGRSVANRIEREYNRLGSVEPDRVRYYEALRCALELAEVVDRQSRPMSAEGPVGWEGGAKALAKYFEGVTATRLETKPS